MEMTQPEMYCKKCGALIPDNNDRLNMGEGRKKPSLLACKECAIMAGGHVDVKFRGRVSLKDLEKFGQEPISAPAIFIR